MKVIDALQQEIDKIKNSESNAIPFMRDDVETIMVCVKYKNQTTGLHYILPPRKDIELFVRELVRIINDNLWETTSLNYTKQKLDPLINEDEFKV